MAPILLAWILPATALLACGVKGDDSGGVVLTYTDANNYAYDAVLAIDTETVGYASDVRVDWGGLTRDLRGRTLEPGEVGWATLIAFSITKEEVLASINDNSLRMSDIRDYRLFENEEGRTSVSLSEFAVLGNEFDPAKEFVEGAGTWTWAVTLWWERDGRDEILFTVFMDPDEASDIDQVAFSDDGGSLSFDVDLHSAPALSTPAGADAYTFDWSAATLEASGQPFDVANGDRLLLGHVAEGTVTDVEQSFLTVLEDADAIYRMDTFGLTSVALSDATERTTGAAFPGFSTDGVWLLGIECTTCTSPVPLTLSVVEVTD